MGWLPMTTKNYIERLSVGLHAELERATPENLKSKTSLKGKLNET